MIDTSGLEWPQFLSRHDLTWQWDWDAASIYTLELRSASLSWCGDGGGGAGRCCVEASATAIKLAACDPSNTQQQWRLRPSGQYVSAAGGGACLSDKAGGGGLLATCNITDPAQHWRRIDGYVFNSASLNCLQVKAPPFCTVRYFTQAFWAKTVCLTHAFCGLCA